MILLFYIFRFIPQAVSAVATGVYKYGSEFYIPFQYRKRQVLLLHYLCFPLPSVRDQRCAGLIVASLLCWHPSSHTASGRYCCNLLIFDAKILSLCYSFNTASGRYCCNYHEKISRSYFECSSFNTASGKHCCNVILPAQHFINLLNSFNTTSGKHCCNGININ